MEQFSLEKWLQDKSRKVVTRLNKQVQIISTEGKEDIPIVALVEGVAHQYDPNGYHADVITACSNQCLDMGDYDLFFADEEDKSQPMEIPFGAFDSEFVKDEYCIPEGCKARIEGNKVIIEKIQKEELTEFEQALEMMMVSFSNENLGSDVRKEMPKQKLHNCAHRLLEFAKKELEKSNPYSGNQKQEWSEEDEKISNAIYESIDFLCLKSFGFSEDEVCDWLKSLRLRHITYELDAPLGYDIDMNPIYPPINHWKPSEAQMDALRTYLYHPQYIDNSEDIKLKFVESLYNDLRKL